MSDIEDPTGFRPARIVATRDTEVGTELEPVVKRVTLDKSRIYQGWPAVRNRHTDYDAARASGLAVPNINGGQTAEYLGELFLKFFGEGFVGGRLAINFLGFVAIEDLVIARGVVTEREELPDGRVRLGLSVWVENEEGRKVLAGTASGYAT